MDGFLWQRPAGEPWLAHTIWLSPWRQIVPRCRLFSFHGSLLWLWFAVLLFLLSLLRMVSLSTVEGHC